jgi:hypothetical protein
VTAFRQYKVHCDGPNCADWILAREDTLAKARAFARRRGWRTRTTPDWQGRNRTRDYCPRHRP